jgi:hypothetical protein
MWKTPLLLGCVMTGCSGPVSSSGGPVADVEVLATRQDNPGGIAFDGTNVYWSTDLFSSGDTTVWRMNLVDRVPEVVVSGESVAYDFTAAGGTVFWSSEPGVAVLPPGATVPKHLGNSVMSFAPAPDGRSIAYLDYGPKIGGPSAHVYRQALTDRTPTLIYDSGLTGLYDIAIDGDTIFLASDGSVLTLQPGATKTSYVAGIPARSIGCITSDRVFFTEYNDIFVAPRGAGEDPTPLGYGRIVGCDSEFLYAEVPLDPNRSPNSLTLVRIPFAGGPTNILIDPALNDASYFAAPDALYVLDRGTTAAARTNGRVLRIPK